MGPLVCSVILQLNAAAAKGCQQVNIELAKELQQFNIQSAESTGVQPGHFHLFHPLLCLVVLHQSHLK